MALCRFFSVQFMSLAANNHRVVCLERFLRYLNKSYWVVVVYMKQLLMWVQGVLFGIYGRNAFLIYSTSLTILFVSKILFPPLLYACTWRGGG